MRVRQCLRSRLGRFRRRWTIGHMTTAGPILSHLSSGDCKRLLVVSLLDRCKNFRCKQQGCHIKLMSQIGAGVSNFAGRCRSSRPYPMQSHHRRRRVLQFRSYASRSVKCDAESCRNTQRQAQALSGCEAMRSITPSSCWISS